MEEDDRIKTASDFLLQAPPGEINDVLNDIRNIIADDESLESGILPALREYNISQLTVVDVPESNHQSIISEAAALNTEDSQERFVDPRSKKSFAFNHLTLEASDAQPYEPNEETEPLRSALETAALNYLTAHYQSGVSAVFSSSKSSEFIIQIVANKYNPSNFWSGRWRSSYVLNTEDKTLSGKVMVNVHYYEQGNVQLESTYPVNITLPPSINADPSSAPKILALVEDAERKYQTNLSDTYHDLGEKTFKGLRRALPLTRQKVDWDKVLGYKLGAELSTNKGGLS